MTAVHQGIMSTTNRLSVSPSPSGNSKRLSRLSTVEALRKGSQDLTAKEKLERDLLWLQDIFHKFSDNKNVITKSQFKELMAIKSPFVSDRLYDVLAGKRPELSATRFVDGFGFVLSGTDQDKLTFLFTIYDLNGDGLLEAWELKSFLDSSLEECDIVLTDELKNFLMDTLYKRAGQETTQSVSLETLWSLFEGRADIMDEFTKSLRQLLKQQSREPESAPRGRFAWYRELFSHPTARKVVAAFLLICLLLFVIGLRHYYSNNPFLILANGLGYIAAFLVCVVMLTVAPRVIYELNLNRLSPYEPIDYFFYIHKLLAYVAYVTSALHGALHVAASEYHPQSVTNTTLSFTWEDLVTIKGHLGWLIPGTAYPTGLAMFLVSTIIIVLANNYFRKQGNFGVFFWSHLFSYVYLVLGIIHDFGFTVMVLLPLLVMFSEKILPRATKKKTIVEATKALMLPSQVIQLVLERPANFHFIPGDYVFVKVPQITGYEKHMFSISSSALQQDELWLHIRVTGAWTQALHDYCTNFEDQQCATMRGKTDNVILSQFNKKVCTAYLQTKVIIDGPYRLHVRNPMLEEHAILIATGTGITPFASILQTIDAYFSTIRDRAKQENAPYKIKKVDFIWVNRIRMHFEWFINLLQDIELKERGSHRFNMHIYLTTASAMTDLKGFALELLLWNMHMAGERDVITGLHTKIRPGRPQWEKLIKSILSAEGDFATVFFSGNRELALVLSVLCSKLGLGFQSFS